MQRVVFNPLFILSVLSLVLLSYLFVDRSIALYFSQYNSSDFHYYSQRLTEFGLGYYYIIPALLGLLFVRFILKNDVLSRFAAFALAATTIPGVISSILKFILSRPRPTHFITHDYYDFLFFQTQATFWSFPSGHATLITGVMVGLALLIPKARWFFIGFAVAVSLTRIIITVHYVSDVIAGMLLGLLTVVWLHQHFCQRYAMPAQLNWTHLKQS